MTNPPLPLEYCDIVMKGGVTSGVVYPLTVVELSQRYTFKNVGGTSAGAIAAAATAAAEYRRRRGSLEGFNALGGLPQVLGRPGFLVSLFAPDPPTRALFRALLSAAESRGPIRAAMLIWSALVRGYYKSALAGAVVGAVVPGVLWLTGVADGRTATILGALWVLTAMTLAVVLAAAKTLPPILVQNRFGLCSGFDRDRPIGHAPLVNWLYGFLNDTAGLPIDKPLTFRDLQEAPVGNDVTGTTRVVNLEMMTTNLTHGRPHRLPLPEDEASSFYFSPEEWADFFPQQVLDHLTSLPREDAEHPVKGTDGRALYPIPSSDLPVIVAVRMSLSFPGLFSAVPLWSVDFTRKHNQRLPNDAPRIAERCWFSDGGLTSNFPVHLFDAPLPRWPTFAINLKNTHPDFEEEDQLVWLPSTNRGGLLPFWNRFDTGSAPQQIGGFISALIDAMQSWRDNLAARMPGYRNRIVHVAQRPEEGGLNLSMPPEAIRALSERGRRAGEALRTSFDFTNHAWVRYRVYAAALWRSMQAFARSYDNPVPQDTDPWRYVKGEAPPPPFPSFSLSASAAHELAAFGAAIAQEGGAADEPTHVESSPRPSPELRLAPRV